MKNIKAELIYTITIPKPGENQENCQDACDTSVENQRFAISDGVTRSLFSADWSKLLVGEFINDEEKEIENLFNKNLWKEWLHPKQKKWEAIAKERVSKLNDPKYYFIRNQFAERRPAAATFIGIRKKPNNGNIWQVMLIGDSCIFHFKKTGEVETYPIKKLDEFGSHPSTFVSNIDKPMASPVFMKLEINSGDYLLLCTDAVSKFLIYYLDASLDEFNKIASRLLQGVEIEKFIETLRQDRNYSLESDDVGIVAIAFKDDFDKKSEINSTNNPPASEVDNLTGKSQLSQDENKIYKQEETTPVVIGKEVKKVKRWITLVVAILSIVIIFGAFFLLGRSVYTRNAVSLVLFPKDAIVFRPDKPIILFEAIREIPVDEVEDSKLSTNGWKKVELDAWFACAPLENGQGSIYSGSPIFVYSSPSDREEPIGFVPANIPVTVFEQYVIRNNIWCHSKWQGYIKNENSGE